MAGAEDTGGDPALNAGREVEQPQRVADVRAGPADAVGQLLVGGAELLEELLVGRRLLERVELLAMQVLQEGLAQHGVVAGLPDDRRDGGLTGFPAGSPPALTHDELVAPGVDLADDDGLQDPDLT